MPSPPIRVLVVDDSAIARKVITDSLAPFPDIEVVGTAIDPYHARDKILQLKPDVLTLDIEMPKMDGLTFLRLMMQHRPMPVIIMSSLTAAGSAKAMEALEAGAVDVLDKPSGSYSAHHDGGRLASKIRAAGMARLRRRTAVEAPAAAPSATSAGQQSPPAPKTLPAQARNHHPRSLILLGSSTGGPEALHHLMTALPQDLPGICIAQHIPACFSKAMADRFNKISRLEVREAVAGDIVKPGTVLVAPGGYHMMLRWAGMHYRVELNQGQPIHHQRPAVDVLFDSALKAGAGSHTIAGILTGMGADGAAGLLELRKAGAITLAQDEASCVVYGMPREAARMGAASEIVSLDNFPRRIEHWVSQMGIVRRGAAA